MIPNRASDAGPEPTRDYREGLADPNEIILAVEESLKCIRRLDPIDGFPRALRSVLYAIEGLHDVIGALRARHDAYEAAQDPDAGRDDVSGEE